LQNYNIFGKQSIKKISNAFDFVSKRRFMGNFSIKKVKFNQHYS